MINSENDSEQANLLEKRYGDKAPDVDVRNTLAELGPIPLGVLDSLIVRPHPFDHEYLVPFRKAGRVSRLTSERG
jgi:hypothetical protein